MKEVKKIYSAFGLVIQSDMELPELISNRQNVEDENIIADINIILGQVPKSIDDSKIKNIWYEVSSSEYLLKVNDIANYYVSDGQKVIIEPNKKSSEEDIRVFLLNSVLAVILQQRGFLILHGSAVVINGKATMFLGASHNGKTAIALSLYDKGCELLSDEVCAIKIEDGKAMILSGIPQLNVWKDTLEKAGRDIKEYSPIRQGIKKYAFNVKDRYYKETIEITNIVILKSHNKDEIIFEDIHGIEKFDKLMKSSYRIDFAEVIVQKENRFKNCVAACKSSNMIQVTFGSEPYEVNRVIDLILKELKLNE